MKTDTHAVQTARAYPIASGLVGSIANSICRYAKYSDVALEESFAT
jgi:hypothetical protein